ncbi:MAG: QueT transporter family protein [Candidatus Zixiibacteriota bacterium]|nr:MAG: QueT transporter family protein [candidate division Zixibacteria bacterium]
MDAWSPKDVAYAGVIAALYAAVTIALSPISYGVYQVRVAEALTVLPFLYFPAVFGLFVGCLVANIFGGHGLQDIVFGSLFTFLAGCLTYAVSKIRSRKLAIALAPLPPVLINAFGVALYLAPITGMPYLFVVQMVGVGQIVSCYLLGVPLLLFLSRRKAPLFQALKR